MLDTMSSLDVALYNSYAATPHARFMEVHNTMPLILEGGWFNDEGSV